MVTVPTVPQDCCEELTRKLMSKHFCNLQRYIQVYGVIITISRGKSCLTEVKRFYHAMQTNLKD